MLDIKHQSGLLEAEQNLLQTSAGFNWDSAWQQIHALIRRMKWSFFFRTIKCSPVWRLDKTAARGNSETVKPPDVTVTHCLIDNLYSQPLLYQHIHISVTLQQKVWGWLVCPHTVSDSVAKKQIRCSVSILSPVWIDAKDLLSLSNLLSIHIHMLPAVCHKAFHRATQQKLTITGFEVDVRMNPKAWTK